jgi:hypothetical protein
MQSQGSSLISEILGFVFWYKSNSLKIELEKRR